MVWENKIWPSYMHSDIGDGPAKPDTYNAQINGGEPPANSLEPCQEV